MVALAGDNGGGKSTVIKVVSGVFQYDSGDILFDGRRVASSTPQEARDNGIETIYEDLALADNLSNSANIFLGGEPMMKLFGILPEIDLQKMAQAAKETTERLDFHVDRLKAPVSAFSGGQREAVAIGRAMFWNARLVIMDEPTRNRRYAGIGLEKRYRIPKKSWSWSRASISYVRSRCGPLERLRRRIAGQDHPDFGSYAYFAFDGQRAAVKFDQRL